MSFDVTLRDWDDSFSSTDQQLISKEVFWNGRILTHNELAFSSVVAIESIAKEVISINKDPQFFILTQENIQVGQRRQERQEGWFGYVIGLFEVGTGSAINFFTKSNVGTWLIQDGASRMISETIDTYNKDNPSSTVNRDDNLEPTDSTESDYDPAYDPKYPARSHPK